MRKILLMREPLKEFAGNWHVKRWELLELSIVGISKMPFVKNWPAYATCKISRLILFGVSLNMPIVLYCKLI